MTTRRNLLMLAGAAVAASATAACQAADDADPAAVRVPDVLVVKTRDGLAVARDGGLTPGRTGALSATGSTLCLATAAEKTTQLDFTTTLAGTRLGGYPIDGRWTPRVVHADGSLVALAAPEGDPLKPRARAKTTIVIADSKQILQRITVPGVIEPDAFTADRQGLFVLEWLPATAPDHYRVRRLDLTTRRLEPLWTRDKVPVPAGAEEEMRGEGRTAVASPTGRVLYTLYTHQPGHQHTRDLLSGRPGNVHAFVHTLETEQNWAYCVDLPDPFGHSASTAYSIALSADGSLLFVVDLAAGALARISTETLKVLDVAKVGSDTGSAYAAASDKLLYVGGDHGVQVLDQAGRPVEKWTTPAVRGLAVSRDLQRVYAARDGGVTWRGSTSGEAALPGLTGLIRVA
ncbi:hypothetical protein AB0M47_42060 [Hamadaea sp. NPDC051192]|uniref:YncE family protein n=1 Tax=Hamadaea sp. NPDC051192 TaxID=3154940 RepID=UPI0034220A37